MKSPAFQFYPGDWLSSPKVLLMTPAQEGAYIRLLCYAWSDEHCSIPDNDEELAVLSRLGEGWLKGGSTSGQARIKSCFNRHPTIAGRLVNMRLLAEREKQEQWREKSQKGGTNSAKSRTSKSSKGGSRVVQPKANTSSSSSIIILQGINKVTGRQYRETKENLSPIKARLEEPGIELEEVKKMLNRQWKLWKETPQAEFYRPSTLFRKTNFEQYYAARNSPIQNELIKSNNSKRTDLGAGTKNEGTGEDYAGVGAVVEVSDASRPATGSDAASSG